MQKSYIIAAVLAIVVGTVSFYGGMQFQKKQRGSFPQRQGQFGARPNDQASSNTGNRVRGEGGMQPINGEIVSQDADGLTLKQVDGSNKIVLLSDQTVIVKSSESSKSELTTGTKVTVFGTANADGSITAKNVAVGTMLMGGMSGRPEPTVTEAAGK